MFEMDWSWFWDFLKHLENHPWTVQVWVAGGATFIFENIVCAGIGVLVASGEMRLDVAFVGMTLGVFIGDILLYLPGRFAMNALRKSRWMAANAHRLQYFEDFFSRHVGKTMFIIRFTPGIRTVALIAAGMLRVPIASYTLYSALSSAFQALLVILIGRGPLASVFPHMRAWWQAYPVGRWIAVVAVCLAFVWVNKILARALTRKVDLATANGSDTPIAWYETLSPFWFNVLPVARFLWEGLKARRLALGFNVNPSIHASGFNGERKWDIYRLFPQELMGSVVAPVVRIPPVEGGWAQERLRLAKEEMAKIGLGWPVVAKPDIGQRGVGVQLIGSESEMLDYFSAYPMEEPVLLQELISLPEEASALYVRYPGEETGRILALTYKQFPSVVGNGRSTLRQLILADMRYMRLSSIFLEKNRARLDQVVPSGVCVPLSFAGNHGQGVLFRNANGHLTEALAHRLDTIARALPDFHYGRFDFRFGDWGELEKGEVFRIIELNGIGGEPVEIWEPSGSLNQAYRWLFRQCRIFFEIGAANWACGHRPISLVGVVREWFAVRRLVRRYPPAD